MTLVNGIICFKYTILSHTYVYIALCVHHPKSSLLPSAYIWPPSPSSCSPHLLSPLTTNAVLPVSANCLFCLLLRWYDLYPTQEQNQSPRPFLFLHTLPNTHCFQKQLTVCKNVSHINNFSTEERKRTAFQLKITENNS